MEALDMISMNPAPSPSLNQEEMVLENYQFGASITQAWVQTYMLRAF